MLQLTAQCNMNISKQLTDLFSSKMMERTEFHNHNFLFLHSMVVKKLFTKFVFPDTEAKQRIATKKKIIQEIILKC